MPLEEEDRVIIDLRDTLSEDAEQGKSGADLGREPTLVAGKDVNTTSTPIHRTFRPARRLFSDRI